MSPPSPVIVSGQRCLASIPGAGAGMWNPETYVDTDYGLDEGESFEPNDAWEPDPFDTSQPHVMTVLGPVSPDDLGITQVHEHLGVQSPNAALRDEDWLARVGIVRGELEFFVTAGGGSMVDASTPDTGRDLDGLLMLAQLVPVNLIASAGRGHLQPAATVPGAGDEELLFEELLGDLQAPIKPGVLSFAIGNDGVTPDGRANARAVARVAAETGYPIRAGIIDEGHGLEALDFVEAAGLNARHVMMGNIDSTWSMDTLTEVGGRGAWLMFDRIGQDDPDIDRQRAATLVRLAHAGFGDRLLVSQGLTRRSDFISQGGSPGWIHVIERFTLTLMDAGADAMLVRTLLIDNPANALTIHPPDVEAEI